MDGERERAFISDLAAEVLGAVYRIKEEIEKIMGDSRLFSGKINFGIENYNQAASQMGHLKTLFDDMVAASGNINFQAVSTAYGSALKDMNRDLEHWKQEQIRIIRDTCSEEIRIVEEARDREIALYRNKITELNDLLSAARTNQRDKQDLDKIKALEDAILYEKDEHNRRQLQKALGKATASYGDRKEIEAVQSTIQHYKDKIQAAKEQASAEIAAAKALREEQLASINAIAAAREKSFQVVGESGGKLKEEAEGNLAEMRSSQEAFSQETERTMTDLIHRVTAIVKEGQEANLTAIKAASPAYKSAGELLGNTFAQAFNMGLVSVRAGIEGLRGELADLSSAVSYASSYNVSSGLASRPSVTNNSLGGITQNFYSNELSPYEARKAAEDIMARLF